MASAPEVLHSAPVSRVDPVLGEVKGEVKILETPMTRYATR
jgi:hypothetical protein